MSNSILESEGFGILPFLNPPVSQKLLWHLTVTIYYRMLKDNELSSFLEYISQILVKLFSEIKRSKLFLFSSSSFFSPQSWATRESATIHIHLQGKKYTLLSASRVGKFTCRRDFTGTNSKIPAPTLMPVLLEKRLYCHCFTQCHCMRELYYMSKYD